MDKEIKGIDSNNLELVKINENSLMFDSLKQQNQGDKEVYACEVFQFLLLPSLSCFLSQFFREAICTMQDILSKGDSKVEGKEVQLICEMIEQILVKNKYTSKSLFEVTQNNCKILIGQIKTAKLQQTFNLRLKNLTKSYFKQDNLIELLIIQLKETIQLLADNPNEKIGWEKVKNSLKIVSTILNKREQLLNYVNQLHSSLKMAFDEFSRKRDTVDGINNIFQLLKVAIIKENDHTLQFIEQKLQNIHPYLKKDLCDVLNAMFIEAIFKVDPSELYNNNKDKSSSEYVVNLKKMIVDYYDKIDQNYENSLKDYKLKIEDEISKVLKNMDLDVSKYNLQVDEVFNSGSYLGKSYDKIAKKLIKVEKKNEKSNNKLQNEIQNKKDEIKTLKQNFKSVKKQFTRVVKLIKQQNPDLKSHLSAITDNNIDISDGVFESILNDLEGMDFKSKSLEKSQSELKKIQKRLKSSEKTIVKQEDNIFKLNKKLKTYKSIVSTYKANKRKKGVNNQDSEGTKKKQKVNTVYINSNNSNNVVIQDKRPMPQGFSSSSSRSGSSKSSRSK